MGPFQMFKRALVTGGAGFIGSHLARALSNEGLEVIVLDDLSMGKIENIPETAEFVKGDIRLERDVTEVLRGVDIVFHEAARVSIRASVKGFYDDADANLMGTLNLLRCCADSVVKKIVYASSMAVYADCDLPRMIDENYLKEPLSPYGISKLAAEKYCLSISTNTNIDCYVLRYFNTYGIGQTLTPYVGVITIFINRLLEGQPPVIFGDGEQRRDFVHVNDIVSANILSMYSSLPVGIYNIGTGVGTSINQIADLLCQKVNSEIRSIHTEENIGELKYSIADTSRAKRDLDHHAKVKLQDKIDEVINYYKTGKKGKNTEKTDSN
jgi:UDP-glucose 4-epimerase